GPGAGDPPVVDADLGGFNKSSLDQPGESHFMSVLLNNKCSCAPYVGKLNGLVEAINQGHIPYGWQYNSNSVTYTGIQQMGLAIPKLPFNIWFWMPGLNPLPLGGKK